jgi:phosphatidylglycerophosphatase A
LRSATVRRPLITFVASGAYSGYLPFAPGTAGSIVGMVIAEIVCAPIWRHDPTVFVILFVLFFAGAGYVAGVAEQLWSQHDSSRIVLDEIFGIIAALFLLPGGWPWVLAAFVLFRLFDVLKPWPASYFDRWHGGAGVMLDDLAAGIYANLVLQIVRRLL